MLEEAKRVSNGTVSFDTQRVVDRLREGGWNEEQARALCDVLREIMRGVATSSEIERIESSLRADMKRVEASLQSDMKRVESKVEQVESSFRSDMRSLEGQMASLRLMMLAGFGFLGVLMTLIGIFVAFWSGG